MFLFQITILNRNITSYWPRKDNLSRSYDSMNQDILVRRNDKNEFPSLLNTNLLSRDLPPLILLFPCNSYTSNKREVPFQKSNNMIYSEDSWWFNSVILLISSLRYISHFIDIYSFNSVFLLTSNFNCIILCVIASCFWKGPTRKI